MDMAKTIYLTRFCIQINNTVVFFQSYTGQTNKKNPKTKNLVNSKQKVPIPCFVSHSFGLRKFIVEQSNLVNIVSSNQLTMFAGIYTFKNILIFI